MITTEQKQKIDEIIKSKLWLNIGIKPESKLADDLLLDSLDFIELIMTLERDFNISIPDELAETIITVQDVYNLIDNLTNK